MRQISRDNEERDEMRRDNEEYFVEIRRQNLETKRGTQIQIWEEDEKKFGWGAGFVAHQINAMEMGEKELSTSGLEKMQTQSY